MHMHSSSKGGHALPKTAMVVKEAFKKNEDGSWTSTQNSDIKSPAGIIRLSAGMDFQKGRLYWGVPVVELLEQQDSK